MEDLKKDGSWSGQPIAESSTIQFRYRSTTPNDARYFLIQPRQQQKFESNPRWASLQPRLLAHTPSYRSKESLLFEVNRGRDH